MKFAKVLSMSSAARLVQAGLSFLLTLVLAASLPLESLGTYIITTATAAISQYLLCQWLTVAILRRGEDAHFPVLAARHTTAFLAAVGTISAITAALVGVLTPAGVLRDILVLAPLVLTAEAAFVCKSNLLAAAGRWPRFSAIYIARGTISLIITSLAALHFRNSIAAIIAYSVATLLATMVVPGERPPPLGLRQIAADLSRALRSHYLLSLNSAIRQVFDRGDRVAVGLIFGVEVAGYYGLAADVVRRAQQAIVGPLMAIMLPQLSRAQAQDTSSQRRVWAQNAKSILWLSSITSVASVSGIDLLFVQLGHAKYPFEILVIAAISAAASILEALDISHASMGMAFAKRSSTVTLNYLLGVLVFAASLVVATVMGTSVVVATGVAASNLCVLAAAAAQLRRVTSMSFAWKTGLVCAAYFAVSVAALLWSAENRSIVQTLLIGGGAVALGVSFALLQFRRDA